MTRCLIVFHGILTLNNYIRIIYNNNTLLFYDSKNENMIIAEKKFAEAAVTVVIIPEFLFLELVLSFLKT